MGLGTMRLRRASIVRIYGVVGKEKKWTGLMVVNAVLRKPFRDDITLRLICPGLEVTTKEVLKADRSKGAGEDHCSADWGIRVKAGETYIVRVECSTGDAISKTLTAADFARCVVTLTSSAPDKGPLKAGQPFLVRADVSWSERGEVLTIVLPKSLSHDNKGDAISLGDSPRTTSASWSVVAPQAGEYSLRVESSHGPAVTVSFRVGGEAAPAATPLVPTPAPPPDTRRTSDPLPAAVEDARTRENTDPKTPVPPEAATGTVVAPGFPWPLVGGGAAGVLVLGLLLGWLLGRKRRGPADSADDFEEEPRPRRQRRAPAAPLRTGIPVTDGEDAAEEAVFKFRCVGCGKVLKTPASLAGKKFHCPGCGTGQTAQG